MNKLKRSRRIVETTIRTKYGTETLKYTGYYGNLIYDDNVDNMEYNTNTMSEIQSGQCNGVGITRDKFWARFPYSNSDGWREYKKVYENNFISYKSYIQYKEVNPSDVKMNQLIKELNVDQFVQYMKDNGLGVDGLV